MVVNFYNGLAVGFAIGFILMTLIAIVQNESRQKSFDLKAKEISERIDQYAAECEKLCKKEPK